MRRTAAGSPGQRGGEQETTGAGIVGEGCLLRELTAQFRPQSGVRGEDKRWPWGEAQGSTQCGGQGPDTAPGDVPRVLGPHCLRLCRDLPPTDGAGAGRRARAGCWVPGLWPSEGREAVPRGLPVKPGQRVHPGRGPVETMAGSWHDFLRTGRGPSPSRRQICPPRQQKRSSSVQ